MPLIAIGDLISSEAFVGDMGVKSICIGDDVIYIRPGSYLYITLETTETEE